MSDTLNLLQAIKQKHNELNRMFTLLLSSLVVCVSFLLWLNDVPLLLEYKPLTGIVLMVLAVIFYKIPYFAYLANCRYFADNGRANELMGGTWKQYRMRIVG